MTQWEEAIFEELKSPKTTRNIVSINRRIRKMKNKQSHTKACIRINDNSLKEVCFCPKREYIKEYEDLISDRTTKRGWSKINSAHDLLTDLVDYINTHYSDNGNKVVLKMGDSENDE